MLTRKMKHSSTITSVDSSESSRSLSAESEDSFHSYSGTAEEWLERIQRSDLNTEHLQIYKRQVYQQVLQTINEGGLDGLFPEFASEDLADLYSWSRSAGPCEFEDEMNEMRIPLKVKRIISTKICCYCKKNNECMVKSCTARPTDELIRRYQKPDIPKPRQPKNRTNFRCRRKAGLHLCNRHGIKALVLTGKTQNQQVLELKDGRVVRNVAKFPNSFVHFREERSLENSVVFGEYSHLKLAAISESRNF